MIHAIGFLFIIASSVALGYLILTGLYPDIAPAVSLIIYGCTAYVVISSGLWRQHFIKLALEWAFGVKWPSLLEVSKLFMPLGTDF